MKNFLKEGLRIGKEVFINTKLNLLTILIMLFILSIIEKLY